MTAPALLSSNWEHWTTPEELVARLAKLGPIGLDPCSNVASVIPAAVELWGTTEIHARKTREGLQAAARKAKRIVTDADLDEAAQAAIDKLHADAEVARAAGRRVLLVDGLAADWLELAEGRPVYVNPPYGREIADWIRRKAVMEAGRGCEIVTLTPARVDAGWFQDGVFGSAQRLCFPVGRFKFGNPPPGTAATTSTFPAAVGYLGRRPARFHNAFLPLGPVFDVARARQAEMELA